MTLGQFATAVGAPKHRVAGVGEFAQVVERSVEVAGGGITYRILDLPALIAAKKAAGRPKDRDQLPELEALLARRKRGAE